MSRAVSVFVLLIFAQTAVADDLPSGATARLGDNRFRAGSTVAWVALSPDGKQFATAYSIGPGQSVLTIWDSATGRPIREHTVNGDVPCAGPFRGIVWTEAGGFALFHRIEQGKLFPDDFRVWAFTDPKAEPPPLLFGRIVVGAGYPVGPSGWTVVDVLDNRPAYTDFLFSADGRRVAAVWLSADARKHAVHVYELKAADSVAQLKRVGAIDLGAEGTDTVCFSADGKALVTFRTLQQADPNRGPEESVATAWDVATGQPRKPVRVPFASRPVVTPDGREVLTSPQEENGIGYDAIDLRTGKRRKLIRQPEHIGEGNTTNHFLDPARTFFPTEPVMVYGDGRAAVLLDLTTGKELGRLRGHAEVPTAIAVSADGERIVTADWYGLIRLWDAKTLRPLHETSGHRSPVKFAQVSPDGKLSLTWARDETIRIWDLATGKELRAFSGVPWVDSFVTRPAFTPDGTTVLYNTTKRLIARDLQTGLEVPLPDGLAKLGPRGAVFSPDGKSLVTCGADNDEDDWCVMWDWPSGKKRFSWPPDCRSCEPVFSPDGSVVFDHPTVGGFRNAKTGEELREPPTRPRSITRAPSGGQYARVSDDSEDVFVVELATGKPRRVLSGRTKEVQVLGFTPDGSKLLTAGADHTVLVWDMRLASVPLPDAVKKETDAAKLWTMLATGKAEAAYLAMARFARDPDIATKMVRLKVKPAAKGDRETDQGRVTDARAVELLEAIDTEESRKVLKELASGDPTAFRTQEAKRALARLEEVAKHRSGK
jgi:WD40 repeat protein